MLIYRCFQILCVISIVEIAMDTASSTETLVKLKFPPLDPNRLASEEASLQTKPINMADDRMDYGTIWNEDIKKRAKASVALLSPSVLKKVNDDFRIEAKSLREEYNLCPGQRFEKQLSAAYCSGILVSNDIVLTAGHCLNEVHASNLPSVDKVHFVFGYTAQNEKSPGQISFPGKFVFKGKELIAGKLSPKSDGGEDWALVRLERSVPKSLAEPVTRSKGKISDSTKVYVLGYPNGIPLKYAAGATVTENKSSQYFVANLDTFGGNSGSGVFKEGTNELTGILVRGFTDYYTTEAGCVKAYRCSSTGCAGEEVTRVEAVPFENVR